jgi:signal transduction histidine kinase
LSRTAPLRRLTPTAFLAVVAVLAVVASAAALIVVYRAGGAIISERERAEALSEQQLLQEVDSEEGLNALVAGVARRARFAAAGEHLGLFDAKGAALAGDLTTFDPDFRNADWKIVRIGQHPRYVLHVVGTTLDDGTVLVVGRSLSNLRRFERAILYGFVAATAIVAVTGFAAGLTMNLLILQRVDAIATTAERIAAGDLSARTPNVDVRDPFGRVGASLNAMLERIEELLTGMRTVTDSLAHDLRSPLTRVKGALARAMAESATRTERFDAIDVAHAEVDHVLATLSAMLDIARAETGLSREMMAKVDVAALVEALADFFTPVIEDAGQELVFHAPAHPVVADAHEALLRQAVGNLLHNASLYAGEGAVVRVSVEEPDDPAEPVRVVVADTGYGVPEDQMGRVQERFVRLDPARTTQGSGLGLAIVAACAKLHRGGFRLENNHPGLRAVLEIGRG